jgi:hypothetical protein
MGFKKEVRWLRYKVPFLAIWAVIFAYIMVSIDLYNSILPEFKQPAIVVIVWLGVMIVLYAVLIDVFSWLAIKRSGFSHTSPSRFKRIFGSGKSTQTVSGRKVTFEQDFIKTIVAGGETMEVPTEISSEYKFVAMYSVFTNPRIPLQQPFFLPSLHSLETVHLPADPTIGQRIDSASSNDMELAHRIFQQTSNLSLDHPNLLLVKISDGTVKTYSYGLVFHPAPLESQARFTVTLAECIERAAR